MRPRAVSAGCDAEASRQRSGPRQGCCWQPTSPTTSSPRECRSATRTRSSARWCGGSFARGASFEALTLAEWRAHSPLFDRDVVDGRSRRCVGKRRSKRRSRPIPTRSPGARRTFAAGCECTRKRCTVTRFQCQTSPLGKAVTGSPHFSEPERNADRSAPESEIARARDRTRRRLVVLQRAEVAHVAAKADVVGEESGHTRRRR